jgi:hypothetical protein
VIPVVFPSIEYQTEPNCYSEIIWKLVDGVVDFGLVALSETMNSRSVTAAGLE